MSFYDPDVNIDPDGGESWTGRRATRIVVHGREIKMLRPICKTCEDEAGGVKYLPRGWMAQCSHDPFVSYSQMEKKVPVYEDDLDPQGRRTGRKKLKTTETVIEEVATPNWVSISQSAGINSGKGPDQALRDGFIFPQQLRSPLWPEGIKRRCQFRDCFAEDIKHYPGVGWFCRDEEAAMVYASDSEETVITAPFGRKAEKAKEKQLKTLINEAKALA